MESYFFIFIFQCDGVVVECKYDSSIQVFKYSSIQVFKYSSIQVFSRRTKLKTNQQGF